MVLPFLDLRRCQESDSMSDSDLSHYLIVKVAGVKFISLNIVNGLMLR